MNLANLIPSWVYLVFIVINVMLVGVSIFIAPQLIMLNILSGFGCFVGYYLSKKNEEEN